MAARKRTRTPAKRTAKRTPAKRARTRAPAPKATTTVQLRAEAKTVEAYLRARNRNGGTRPISHTPEWLRDKIAVRKKQVADGTTYVQKLKLMNELLAYETELDAVERNGVGNLEAEFVKVAKRFGERHEITYRAWRELNVLPAVLKAAGIG